MENLIEANIQQLFSSSHREQGLADIKYTLEQSGFEPFSNHLENLFKGFKACLADSNVDNMLL
jgi:DNA-binding transcriptional regulator WhiA